MGQKIKARQSRKPRNVNRHGDGELHSVLKVKAKRHKSPKGFDNADPIEFWSDPCWTDPL